MDQSCSYALQNQNTTDIEVSENDVVDMITQFKQQDRSEVEQKLKEEKAADQPLSHTIDRYDPLKTHADDFTRDALIGRIAPLKIRQETVQKMMQVLGQPSCNNVILIGPAGTGKTTIVQQLALLIAKGNVPIHLQNKPLLSLRLTEILGNDNAFGQVIQSMKKHSKKFVLFVDEIHRLFSSMKFEELKPLLSDGHVSLIGATTEEDFSFEDQDESFKTRFTLVEFQAPKRQEAFEMLLESKGKLEEGLSSQLKKKVVFTEGALNSALKKSDKNHWPRTAVVKLEQAALKKGASDQSDQIQVESTDVEAQARKVWKTISNFFSAIGHFIVSHPKEIGGLISSVLVVTLVALRIFGVIPSIGIV